MRTIETPKREQLYIVPFGLIQKEVSVFLQCELTRRLGFDVKIHEAEPVPHYAFNQKRNQYHSTKILEMLKRQRIKEERILGIIDCDLCVPELNFVFGEADIGSNVCIISLVRLRQEYYGLSKNDDLFLLRTLKEAIHEIGHIYLLGHCTDPKCIMHFSNSLRDTDIKGPDFCDRCKLKLR